MSSGLNYSWDSSRVTAAIIVAIGAGLATGIGGLVVFVPQVLNSVPKATVLAVALAISAGVMLYVSFIEIFIKAKEGIQTEYPNNDAAATGITTVCFFSGMFICAVLEFIVHLLHRRFSPGALHDHNTPMDLVRTQSEMEMVDHSTSTAEPAVANAGQASVAVGTSAVANSQSATSNSRPAQADGGESGGHHEDFGMDKAQRTELGKMGAMTAVAIALHNFPEGLATFLATVSDPSVGLALGIAIAVHNVPEGVCVAMPIYYATGSKLKGFFWSVLSGLTEPIGGIVGYAILQPVFTDFIFGVVFSMVGGMMVFIVLHELIPAGHRYMPTKPATVTAYVTLGMAIMALSLVLFAL